MTTGRTEAAVSTDRPALLEAVIRKLLDIDYARFDATYNELCLDGWAGPFTPDESAVLRSVLDDIAVSRDPQPKEQ